mgnify:CR=1 FL=1
MQMLNKLLYNGCNTNKSKILSPVSQTFTCKICCFAIYVSSGAVETRVNSRDGATAVEVAA